MGRRVKAKVDSCSFIERGENLMRRPARRQRGTIIYSRALNGRQRNKYRRVSRRSVT